MRHHVRKQTLHVTVGSEALAFALQPRLQDLNRTVFLPAIERVFDELSPADQHTLLTRLEIDLGTISMTDLDAAGARFERILREVVRAALYRVKGQSVDEGRTQPEHEAQEEALERYLTTGTLPFWASAKTFSLEEWIAQLSAAAPERLTDLLLRRRFDASVLQRMTHQLGEELVQALLKPLDEPGDGRIDALYRTDRPAFLGLIRHLRDEPVTKRFLLRLDHEALEDLVRQLAPEHADEIAADVAGLASLPYLGRRTDARLVLRHLWLMTADVELKTLDRPYERRSFVRAVLTALAESDGRLLDDLLAALAGDLPFPAESESEGRPGTPSLRLLVADMAADRSPAPAPAPTEAPGRPHAQPRAPRPRPVESWPLFTRYDRVDAVDYFARHGVMPYSTSLLRPELAIADAVDSLVDLPLGSLRAMLADLGPDARVHAWRRLVQHVPHERLTRFVASLIERTGRPAASIAALLSAPTAQAAGRPRTQAEDQPLAYARLIVRLLDERRTEAALEPAPDSGVQPAADISAQPAPDIGVQKATHLPDWETHRIKAVLSSRARATSQAGVQEPTSLQFLLTLIDRDVEGARHFLEALRLASVATSALLDEVPSESAVKTFQKLLSPEASSALTRLLDSFRALAPADRPADATVYSAVAIAILDQHPETTSPESFVDTVLRQVAGTSRAAIRTDDLAAVSPPDVLPARETLAPNIKPVEEEATSETRDVFSSLEKEPTPEERQVASSLERETSVDQATLSGKKTPPGWLARLGGVSDLVEMPSLPDDVQRHDLLSAIDEVPDLVHVALLERIGNETIRRRWAQELSEPELVRLAYLLEPRLHRALIDGAELLFAARLRVTPDHRPWTTRRTELWSWVLDFLAETRTSERSLDRLVARFFTEYAGRNVFGSGPSAGAVPGESQVPAAQTIESLFDAAVERAWAAGSIAMRAILDRDRAMLIASPDVTHLQSPSDSDSTRTRASDPGFRDMSREPDAASPGASRELGSAFREMSRGPDAASPGASRELDSAFQEISRGPDAASPGASREPDSASREISREPDAASPGASREPDSASREMSREPDAASPGASREPDSASRDLSREPDAASRAAPPHDLAGRDVRPPAERGSAARFKEQRIRPAFSMDEGAGEKADAEPIYIANAGLVLTNPFLPHWLSALDFLESPEPGKTRLRPDRLSRAIHLLQWLVDGSVAAPEPQLCLNKLLCGAPFRTPVARRIEPTEQELEICQQLLKSMLANWTILSGTSIDGLRETFLQREGRLEPAPGGGWRLVVQRKTLDVLLDHMPWSISAVAHAWMPESIFVTW